MSRTLQLLALLPLALAGCTDDVTTATATGEERVADPTRTPLTQVRLSPTHTVDFTESSDGALEVVEHMHADQDIGQPSIAALDDRHRTLAELHRYLVPGAPVPAALIDADTRAAARTPAPNTESPPPDAFSVSDMIGEPTPPSIQWDWVGDEAWFKQYFYTGGTAGYFAANTPWASVTKNRYTKFFKSSAFNQSFEGGAWFRVKRSYGCGLGTCSSTSLNEAVANRHVTTYLGDGTSRWRQAWMDGSGVNPRIGLATRWTLASDGNPTPPTVCGGHLQLTCWVGAACNPGLVPYNGGCYGCGTVGQGCCKDLGPIPTNGGWTGWCAQGHCGYPGGFCQMF